MTDAARIAVLRADIDVLSRLVILLIEEKSDLLKLLTTPPSDKNLNLGMPEPRRADLTMGRH